MKLVFLLSIASLAAALPLKDEWENWRREHGKQYLNELEESLHHAAWFQSYHHIQQHNQRENSFKLSLNEFSDLVCTVTRNSNCTNNNIMLLQTPEQFQQKYLSPINADDHLSEAVEEYSVRNLSCPTYLDLRSMGFVTDVCFNHMYQIFCKYTSSVASTYR